MEHRLAIVLSHPIQYYSPWFRWIKAHHALAFRVFYLSDFGLKPARDAKFETTFAWDVDLTSGYEWEMVPNTASVPDTLRFSGLRNPELPRRLAAWKPTAILLFGYKYHTHLKLIAWARRKRIPLIFRGDSHLLGRGRRRGFSRWLLSFLYRQFSAFTYVGQANRDYFRALKVPDHKLFFSPHSVDESLFDPSRPDVQEAASALKASLGIPLEHRVILFAGKLIPSKQPGALLEAFVSLSPPNATLCFVGDGPEKTALQTAAATAAHLSIRFMPFANQSEMPVRYLLADLLVLPSRGYYETWGLSVNEAMHMGVPCLVSDQVGCQRDLVDDGQTGWVFAADRPTTLAPKLAEALAALGGDRKQLRTAVAERIGRYTFAQTTDGLLAAISSTAST